MFFIRALLLLAVVVDAWGDSDTIMNPIKDGPPVALIIVQGAQIQTAAYQPLAKAIQKAAPYKLFVAIPAFALDTPEPLVLSKGIADAKAKLYAAGLPQTAPIVYAGHSLGGAMLQDYVFSCTDCPLQVLMGSGLLRKYSNGTSSRTYPIPTLTIDGTLDGLMRVTRQAENYYHYILHGDDTAYTNFPVVIFEGMNHMQFASGTPPALVAANDLASEITNQSAWDMTAGSITDFMNVHLGLASPGDVAASKANLKQSVAATGTIVSPLISSLEQEGFIHFKPPCNSDYPMPECPWYPRYPSGQQGDTPQVDCTCATPFVATVAQFSMANLPDVTIETVDAIHPVSDITPIHLPHIFSPPCQSESGCVINSTTVTFPVYSSVDSLDTGFSYTSASELKVKLMSRQAMWISAGKTNVNYTETDVNVNSCRDINQLSYKWALNNAGAAALSRFQKIGTPFEFGDDIFLGNAGPIWIENPLEFNETPNKSAVVVRAPCTHTPIDYTIKSAAGFHYCKVLSPARAMEWIYIDGLRNNGHI